MPHEVDFHTGLDDKLAYACRLLRKAVRAGKVVAVTGAAAELARLDLLLWTFEPGEFIAHVRLRAGDMAAPRLARTPVWLVDRPEDAPACDVLVNLGPQAAHAADACARVIELVARDEADVEAARQRWRRYKAAGIAPRSHVQPVGGSETT
jgi:DNA polymerase III subunit chi